MIRQIIIAAIKRSEGHSPETIASAILNDLEKAAYNLGEYRLDQILNEEIIVCDGYCGSEG